jgi:O-antigen/teichoic acid export membrane protein
MFATGRNIIFTIVQFIFTPIIARYYGPEAYGTFGIMFSFSSMGISLFTLQYDKALLLASDEKDILTLRNISTIIPLYLSILLFILILLFKNNINDIWFEGAIENELFILPIMIFIGAAAQSSQQMVNVRSKYKEGFIYGSYVSLGTKLAILGYGMALGGTFWGMALSEIMSKGAQIMINTKVILKEAVSFKWTDLLLKDKWWAMRKYIDFPRYELPAAIMSVFSNQLPAIFIPATFGIAALGSYALAASLLEVPMRLIGYSITGTFYQKAARIMQRDGPAPLRNMVGKVMATTGAIGAAPLLVIAIWGESLFVALLGSNWALSGTISSVLTVFYITRLTIEPIMSVLRVTGAQRAYFRLNLGLLILRLTAIALALWSDMGLIPALLTYSIFNSIGYLTFGCYIWYHLSRLRRRNDLSSDPVKEG